MSSLNMETNRLPDKKPLRLMDGDVYRPHAELGKHDKHTGADNVNPLIPHF